MMHLYNGRVQLVLKTRKRIEISTQAVFNDGLWHKVMSFIFTLFVLFKCLTQICFNRFI